MKAPKKWVSAILIVTVLSVSVGLTHAQDGAPIVIEITEVTPPTECRDTGWIINYERTLIFTVPSSQLQRYNVQYINDDLTLAHYWGSGYSGYVQDYGLNPGNARIVGSYTPAYWTDTYHAVSIDYVLVDDLVVWEIRAELTCDAGTVADYSLTAQTADSPRDSLPAPGENLVITLDEIVLYPAPGINRRAEPIGTITPCQTFYISGVHIPRTYITTYATESIADTLIELAYGLPPQARILDVPENYGQAGGAPILDECTGQ